MHCLVPGKPNPVHQNNCEAGEVDRERRRKTKSCQPATGSTMMIIHSKIDSAWLIMGKTTKVILSMLWWQAGNGKNRWSGDSTPELQREHVAYSSPRFKQLLILYLQGRMFQATFHIKSFNLSWMGKDHIFLQRTCKLWGVALPKKLAACKFSISREDWCWDGN